MQIATTADVVAVEESGYPARHYLARDGVDMGRLEKTEKMTCCPFKGLATYYVIRGRQGEIRDAVWSYATSGRTARPSSCVTASRLMPRRLTRPWGKQRELPQVRRITRETS